MTRTSLVWCCCVLLSLSACKDNEEEGTPDSGTPAAMTLTVSGKVVDPRRKPLPNATVLIAGKEPVTTDASGAFSISGVTPPYDITAVGGSRRAAIVYQGATHPNPTVFLSTEEIPSFSATLAGAVSGVRTPSATVSEPNVVFASWDGEGFSPTFSADFSTYSLNAGWYGPPTTTGSLFAFQGERTSATATVYTRFTGFGRRDNVSLSNEATVSNQNVALGSVVNSSLAGTVSAPTGFRLISNAVNLRFAQNLNVPLVAESFPGSSFSYAVPVVAQSTYQMTAVATAGAAASSIAIKNVAAGANDLSFALRAPPTLTLPLDNATNVTRATEFSWTANADGVHITVFERDTSSGGTPYSITVITRATRTTLPDLSALGMALPASTPLTWRAQGISPIASVDTLLAGYADTTGLPIGLDELYFTVPDRREFTTSPTP